MPRLGAGNLLCRPGNLVSMQTRYLLVASLVTGLVILIAGAVWMATRL
jgi:uncharacterized membrane protein